MTTRVVAFDANAGGRAGPQLLSVTPVVLDAGPATAARPQGPPDLDRAQARAHVAAAYAAVLGTEVAMGDLLDHIRRAAGDAGPGLDAVAGALRKAGLSATVRKVPLHPDLWPALAAMTSGQVVLVLGQGAGGLTVYDPTCADSRADIPVAEFAQVYAGQVLVARATMADVAARHAEPGAAPHWFWGEFARHRRALAEVAAGARFANQLATAIARFSLQVYDRVIPHQSQATLWVLALGVLLAVVLEAALKVARARLMDMTGRRIELAVQARLMGRLLGMRADPAGRSPSQMFGAMREFSSVREFFTSATIGTLTDLPFVLLFLGLVAMIGGPLVWVLVAGGVLMVVPGLLLQGRMVALTAATQGSSTRAARLLYETIQEHETIATQRGEDRVNRIWNELTALSAARSSDQRDLTAWLTAWAQGVSQATYVLAVVAGTYLVFAGSFTVGTIIAIGILTGRTLGPLAGLAGLIARWTNVKAALAGLDAIARAPQAEEPGRTYLRRERLGGAFELRGVTFRYAPDAPPTIEIAAMAIPAGQHVAVLGTNGAGKSTLLRILAGLSDATGGRVLVDGLDMGQIHPRDLRRGLGYLAQEVRLVAGTLRDNLNLHGLERDDDRLLAGLDFAGLGPFVRGHPRGLDLPIHEGGAGLSVGQRQSLGWARLWLQDPPVVILDEPTAALDQTLEGVLVSRLQGWLRGRTAVIATHRVPILQLTDRVVILQNGKAAVDGPRDAVLAHLMKGAG
ncbi:MAG: ATP-binding cassette domain-containing protein [Gemmobacter sp.]